MTEASDTDKLIHDRKISRRKVLLNTGAGLGGLALADILAGSAAKSSAANSMPSGAPVIDKGVLQAGQFPAKAKRVIWIHMWGAVSQVDTFDYKPTLIKMHGQQIPPSVKNKGGRVSAMSAAQSSFPLIKPMREFNQYGQSGAWVSDLFPHQAKIVDDVAFIKTVWTEHVNHDPAAKFLHTGFQISGRPSAGAWVNYALGTDNNDLPSFVVLASVGTGAGQGVDAAAFGSGFLPSHHQGVQFRSGADPVLYVNSPDGVDRQDRRQQLDVLGALSKVQYERSGDPEILSKITQYEMAYRMQDSVPEVADIANEPQHVLDLYGPDVMKPGTFARNCLIARRLVERNVKFIEVIMTGWDHHTGLEARHPIDCQLCDQPTAGLVMDLKQRGLLDDTLVIFGSEFGRTSFAQGDISGNWGRDHHGGAFTYWMAGGGVKAGYSHGETDDFSYNIVKDPVAIHDLQATMLRLMGIDHKQLTYHYQGRDFRLTDVHGEVIREVLA